VTGTELNVETTFLFPVPKHGGGLILSISHLWLFNTVTIILMIAKPLDFPPCDNSHGKS
jgi:hypothetical protein